MSKIDKSLAVYNIINTLNNVKRRGWIKRQIPERIESVSEHCFAMSNLAILINLQYNLNLDMTKVLTMINIHDYGEAKIGDIIPKDGIAKDVKYNMELQAITEIMNDHPGQSAIVELWKEFEACQTKEAIFVSLLDKYQSVLQAREYSKRYNRIEIYEEFAIYYEQIFKKIAKEELPESARLLTL